MGSAVGVIMGDTLIVGVVDAGVGVEDGDGYRCGCGCGC